MVRIYAMIHHREGRFFMIVCVSLNPCLDKSAFVDRFSFDMPNRITLERLDVAGKGVNVARVLHTLAGDPCLVGFDYQGAPVENAMQSAGIACHLVPVGGELRTNMKLRELEKNRTIEISERGAAVSARHLAAVEELLRACQPGTWISLSGSLPPGAPQDTYARLCRMLKKQGCLVAVDCDGPALRFALEEGPDLFKPNAQEFFALTGTDANDLSSALDACRGLHQKGVGMICLSRGADGALLSGKNGAWICPAAPVKALGVQGAGDSMLAGLMLALGRRETEDQALRFASAIAGASVMQPGTLLCNRADVERLVKMMPDSMRCS